MMKIIMKIVLSLMLVASVNGYSWDSEVIDKPVACAKILDDDREIGGDEFWRFHIDYESRNVIHVKKHELLIGVDVQLQRLVWSSSWGFGQNGRLDILEKSLVYRRGGASVDTIINLTERPRQASFILRQLIEHVNVARKNLVDEEALGTLDCFESLIEAYIESLRKKK